MDNLVSTTLQSFRSTTCTAQMPGKAKTIITWRLLPLLPVCSILQYQGKTMVLRVLPPMVPLPFVANKGNSILKDTEYRWHYYPFPFPKNNKFVNSHRIVCQIITVLFAVHLAKTKHMQKWHLFKIHQMKSY